MTTIDVDSILAELDRAHETTTGATASTMTLVAYVDDAKFLQWIRERTREIVEKHPARVLLLDGTCDPQRHGIQTIREIVGHRAVTRGEWIDLGTCGLPADTLTSIAHAFTVRSVPTVLLWAGHGIVDDPIFLALNAIADSLVLDSSRLEDGVTSLNQLTEYFAQEPRFAVQDLAYLRLGRWQEMIASFFDDAESSDDLFALREVEISAGSQAEAYYLLGWLASRLQWSPCARNEMCNREGKPVIFEIVRKGRPRRVYDVTLRSAETVFRATLQEGEEGVVSLSVEGAAMHAARSETLHDLSIVALLEQAILTPKTSDVYRATLEATRAILKLA
jgi:glucose-6-phosphate dehydrogenase assembly protein OpcA